MSEICAEDFIRRMMFDGGFRRTVKGFENTSRLLKFAMDQGYDCDLEELDRVQKAYVEELGNGDGMIEVASAGWGVPFATGVKSVRACPEEGWEHTYLG